MSESLVIFGKTWTGVNGFKVKDTSDVTKTYIKQDGTVTQNLTNVTSSNQTAVAVGSWSTKLTPPEGYLITSITVTMGGADVTNQVFTPDVWVEHISTYDVAESYTAVKTSNIASKVVRNGSLYIKLEPESNSDVIRTVTVTMGGVDITSQVFTGEEG